MNLNLEQLQRMEPKNVRSIIRKGEIFGHHTMGACEGYSQSNVAIVPKKHSLEFMIFCQRNPKPCPVIEVLEPGKYLTQYIADAADIRTDVPQYRVFKDGVCVDEPSDIMKYWRDDLVTFFLGCSATFDHILSKDGVELAHLKGEGTSTSIYISNIELEQSGPFRGKMVVSARAIKHHQINHVIQTSSRYPLHHGSPVHTGDPGIIGIDLNKSDWGPPLKVAHGSVPMFWGCGVTPHVAAVNAKLELMITHYPASMFLTDRKHSEFAAMC